MKARYTEEARNKKKAGSVILSVEFKSDSMVREILVVKGLKYGLTESALEAAN